MILRESERVGDILPAFFDGDSSRGNRCKIEEKNANNYEKDPGMRNLFDKQTYLEVPVSAGEQIRQIKKI
jgi:hypothetical protein